MNNEQNISSDICTFSENNLEAVLFSEFSGTENMIITSDNINNLSELDGALCFDETTNELVYVNMIQPNLNTTDSLTNASPSVFSALGGVPTFTDVSAFNDGNAVMLLSNGSIVIPNDDDNLVSAPTDPFILQFVQNPSDAPTKGTLGPADSLPADPSSDSAAPVASSGENDVDGLLDNSEMNYQCELCSKKFFRNKEYRAHVLSHKEKVHKCSHCGNSFNKLKNLILHEALHNPVDTICPLAKCQKKFRRLASLKAHIKLHEEDETLTCIECGEEFRNQMFLEQHFKCQPQCRSNLVDVNEPSLDTVSKSCKLCNRKFQNSSTLAAHKKEHEKIKKALATKNHRKKTISSSKPSSRVNRCKVCPKWFFKPSQLIRHMRIHTGERPFECTECHKAFNQANSLKIHMLKHTGDRPYLCPFCHSGFSQRGNLRQHINRVHSIPKVEDLVYECSECPCIFKKICSLNAHRNRVHRKGYKLVLSTEEAENEEYISGHRVSPISTSPERSNDGKDGKSGKSSRNKNSNHMYMCPECTSTFKTVNGLKIHLNEVHVQLPTPRDERENSITLENNLDDLDEEEMEKLLKKQTTVNTITIAVDKGGGELWNQKVFIKKNGNRQSYQCSHCPKESAKLNEMIRHIKVNVIGKVFKCKYCAKTFSQHSTFKTHLSLHATAKTYNCQVCQQTFSNPAELNAHSKSHAQINDDVMCMTCLKTYSSKERGKHQCLSTQMLLDFMKMDNVARPVEMNDVQHLHDKVNLILPPYTCTRCNITFKSYGKLKSHLKDHGSKACKHCNLRFSIEEKLQEHVNAAHQGEAKNTGEEKCSTCGEYFKDARSFARHTKKAHPKNQGMNVMTANAVDRNESVLCINSGNDVLSKGVTENNASKEGTTDIRNNVREFVIPENQTVDSVVNGELNLKCDLANDRISSVNASVAESNDTLELDLCMKNNVSYIMTNESLDDCFLNSQVSTLALPVDDVLPIVPSTNSMFNTTGDIIYKCTGCNNQYSSELDLQKHFQESEMCNNGMPDTTFQYFYACNTCYLTFKSLNSFLRHLQTHNGTAMYTCIYCDAPNKTEAELTQHIAAHALKKEYPCVHCGELAETVDAVKRHITDVHLMSSANSKTLETKRKKTISSELLLTEKEKLMLVDQKPNKYSSISEKVLSSLLKKNVRKENCGEKEEILAKAETPAKEKKKRSNLNAKENRCSYCDRSFKKMCDLIRHIRIHTGERPFKCDYCNKCFTVKSILNCHLKTHFTVKNIFCHICNRFFSTVGSLKIHMRLHTGDRPYKCLYCKESFRTSGHRDSHQKRHLGEKDKARMVAIEAAMAELENQENTELSLDEAMNLQDGHFLISEITDIENFKFQENTDMDLLNVDSLSNMNDCTLCGKSFKKADLAEHICVHHSDRELTCVICNARFNQLDTLKAHMKRHVPPTSIQCDVREKMFMSAKNLKGHKVRQHPETLQLPFEDDNESILLTDLNEKSNIVGSSNADVHIGNTNDGDKSKWTETEDLNFSVLVGKNKKTDVLSDFFITGMDNRFDLNTMMSDLFPDDEK